MNEEVEIKIHNLFLKADENGVCDIARKLWGLKHHFIAWVYENYWEFRVPIEEDKTKNFYTALIVYPTSTTIRNYVLIALKNNNLERLYQKTDRECQDFINRLHYMLGKPELPQHQIQQGWDYLLLSTREEAYLFVKEFCFLAGY